ncbi:MAG TPA: hypothetical protein VIM71_05280 [Lacunisphaera sp.]
MNDELEQRLRALRLTRPSAELDRRMDDIFRQASVSDASMPRHWWWLAALAAGAVAASLVLIMNPTVVPAPPEPVVYHIEAPDVMREWLAPTSIESRPPPVVIVSVLPSNPAPL